MKNNDRTYYLRSNQELFDATMNMFSSMNYDIASLNDIIKNGHSNKGSFYYRFKDKYDLYLALIDALFIEQVTYINLSLSQVKAVTLSEHLYILFDALVHLAKEDSRFLSLSHRFYSEKDTFIHRVLQDTLKSPLVRIVEKIKTFENSLMPQYVLILNSFYGDFESFYQAKNFDLPSFVSMVERSMRDNVIDEIDITNKLDAAPCFDDRVFQVEDGKSFLTIFSKKLSKKVIVSTINKFTPLNDQTLVFSFKKSLSFFQEVSKTIKTIHSKRSVKSYLSYYGKRTNTNFDIEFPLTVGFLEKAVSELTEFELIRLYLVLCSAHKYRTIVFSYILERLNSFEKAELFDILLKYRQKGSRIILIESRISDSYQYVDEVIYFNEELHPMVALANDLRVKYQPDDVILSLNGNILLLSNDVFLKNYKLLKDQVALFASLSSTYDMIIQFELGGNKE